MHRKLKSLFLTIGLASISHAAVLSGTLNIAGLDNVRVTGNMIDFLGSQSIIATSDGLGVTAGTTGTIKDLTNSPADQPVGAPFTLDNFISIGNLNFTLRFIPVGVNGSALCGAPEAAGQQCTPPGTPFNLSNTSSNTSTASFRVMGTVSDGSSSPASNFDGLFTTQFLAGATPTGGSYQDILQQLASAGSIDASYSATLEATVTPIPEPASMLLIGSSLLGVGLLRRKINIVR